MEVRIVHINRPDEDDERRERNRTRRDIQSIMEMIMALSAQVAAALEQARKLDNVMDAVNSWGEALQAQVRDLKDQIVNQSPSLSEEDKAALAEITKEIQENIARAPAAIMEGTGQTPSDGSTEPPPPVVAEPVENDPAPPATEEEIAAEQPVDQGTAPQPEAPADPNAPAQPGPNDQNTQG